MKCPKCQFENPEGSNFCGGCARKFDLSCSECGANNPLQNKFCNECGTDLRLVKEVSNQTAETKSPPVSHSKESLTTDTFSGNSERKHVTVLFSDLTGYTAMSEKLDPEEVKEVTSQIFGDISKIVGKYDGFIEKYAGDAVMAIFGVPNVHEDDPVRAIRAAKEIHAMVDAISPQFEAKIGQPLSMHTGINTGLVITGEVNLERGTHGVVGYTINLASRLSDMAKGGEILVSPETLRFIDPYFETEALEPITIKGKAQPLIPYKVTEKSRVHTRIEAAEQRGFSAFTGREKELATLRSCLDIAMAGKGQVVTVGGEAGVGKSRLIYEFLHCLDRNEITVLQGFCQSYGSEIPYFPFLDALRRRLHLYEKDTPAELSEKAISNVLAIDQTLEQYLPLYLHLLSIKSGDYPLPEYLQGEELKKEIDEALAAINTLNSKRQPMVLVLEDWHWTDEASDASLKYLIGMIANYSIYVVVIHRPSYRPQWSDLSYHTPVTLVPLDRIHAENIIKSVLGADHLPKGFASLIHKRTGGNPFFVEEVCRSLSEEGVVVVKNGHAVLTQTMETLRLPDTVQAIISTRLDRLEPDVKEAIQLASVIGIKFSRQILEKLYATGTSLSQALEKLKTLEMIQQTKIIPEAEYRFKHVLTQKIAYETLLLQRRKVLHGLVGQAIEELYPDRLEEQVNLLQHHFNQAENWQKAVHYGCQAAKKARRLSQFHDAVTMYEQAQKNLLRLPKDQFRPETLIDILLQQERLYEALGRRERQQAIIDQLLALLQPEGDSVWLAEVYVRQGDLNTQIGRFGEAERVLGKALTTWRVLSDATGESRALRSMGFLRWHQSRYKEAIECNEAALVIDRQHDDPTAIATDLINLSAVWRNLRDHKRALGCLEEALQLYETTQNPVKQGFTRLKIGNVHHELGAHDRAMKHYQQAHDIFTQHRDRLMELLSLTSMASTLWEQGKPEESLGLYKNVLQMARDVKHAQGLALTLRTMGELLVVWNEPHEALHHLLESTEIFAELKDRKSEAEAWGRIANIYDQILNDYQNAFSSWEKAQKLRRLLNDGHGALQALQQMGKLAWKYFVDPTRALQYYQQAIKFAIEMNNHKKQGELLRAMGDIEWHQGADTEALAHYEQTLQVYQELGDIDHTGLMLNSIGVTLRRLGRYEEALERLREAVATNHKAGQRLLEGHGLAAIGDVYRDMGEHGEALDSYQASLNLRREIGDRKGEGWMLHSLALEFDAKNSPAQAYDCVAQALAIAEECADEELLHACTHMQDQLSPTK